MFKFLTALTVLFVTIQVEGLFFSLAPTKDFSLFFFEKSSGAIDVLGKGSHHLDPSLETIIVIHGYLSSGNASWVHTMAQLYHQLGDYNVVAVDWSKIARGLYPDVVARIDRLSKKIVNRLVKIIKDDGLDVGKMHVVGHSLGAHVGGLACKGIKAKLNKSVARLTGLDVAGPLYEFPLPLPSHLKFNRNDAIFVDAIHTNGGTFGVVEPYGQVDFYINGGVEQPGCVTLKTIVDVPRCSHDSAHVYYSQALKSPGSLVGEKCEFNSFTGHLHKCSSSVTAAIGESLNGNVSAGIYAVKTENSPIHV